MLQLRGVSAGYGSIEAIKGVDLTVGQGEFVAILGPNGAGKSTLMKTVAGVLPPTGGSVVLEGRDISNLAPADRISRGLSVIPEGRQLFPDLTVRENLVLGAYPQLGFSVTRALDPAFERVFALFPRLAERQRQLAGSLSGGEAQMLAIGRALMTLPRLLLCDEPSLGLAPTLVRELLSLLGRLRDEGLTIALADQNAIGALRIADRAYVLDTGRVVASGSARSVERDARLRSAYLGLTDS